MIAVGSAQPWALAYRSALNMYFDGIAAAAAPVTASGSGSASRALSNPLGRSALDWETLGTAPTASLALADRAAGTSGSEATAATCTGALGTFANVGLPPPPRRDANRSAVAGTNCANSCTRVAEAGWVLRNSIPDP